MFYKAHIIIILTLLFLTPNLKAQTKEYNDAISLIVDSKEYLDITKNKKRYHVSNEIILFSKLGMFYQDELKEFNSLSDEQIAMQARNKNLFVDLTSLNKKKCSKAQIYFSEIKKDIFFAELIESKKVVSYSKRPNFGVSQVYMFKAENGKVELLDTREIAYN